jgi:predicted neutral ceramidase superfamily lipid hydrolase
MFPTKEVTDLNRSKTLLITAVAAAIVYILWNIPALDIILYPLRLFTTYVHESFHAITTLFTGGQIVEFVVGLDGEGHILRRGGWDWLVTPAGYLGAALFGSILFYVINRFPRSVNAIAATLGIAATLFTLRFAFGNFLALFVGVVTGMILMALGLKARPFFTLLVMNLLAISTALNAFFDLQTLMRVIEIAGADIPNDAVSFSQRVTPLIPAWMIALIWAGIAILMFAMALFYGAWKPLRSEIDDSYNSIMFKKK